MMRDTPFTAGAPSVRATAPTRHLHSAIRALARRERTAAELEAEVQRAHPTSTIGIAGIIRRGLDEELFEPDGNGLIGLTEAGWQRATSLRAEDGLAPQVRLSEHERRIAAIAPGVNLNPHDLVRGQTHATSSSADLAPPPMRAGTAACLALPSRIGDHLHYRDGRVTDLQGNAL